VVCEGIEPLQGVGRENQRVKGHLLKPLRGIRESPIQTPVLSVNLRKNWLEGKEGRLTLLLSKVSTQQKGEHIELQDWFDRLVKSGRGETRGVTEPAAIARKYYR